MLTSKQIERVTKMVETLANKHEGQMHWLQLRWEQRDTYDVSYGGYIEETLPFLDIAFK